MHGKKKGQRQFFSPVRAFSVCFLLLWFAFGIQAQQASGSISGVVLDPQGAVVGGAKVTLTDQRQGALREGTTNAEGAFIFTSLQASDYTLAVQAQGFTKREQKDIKLFATDHLALNQIQLAVGSVTDTVNVEASAVALQTVSAERSGTITGTQLVDLAINGRSYWNFMTTVPGVPADSMYNSNGRRSDASNLTMDGVTAMDSGNNGVSNLVALNTDAIAEFKVLTNSQSAEFGRMSGAQVAMITKSGSRQFHGTGYIFHRHEDLNANTFTNNAQRILRPRYRFNTPGFNIGGPIPVPGTHYFKDKLFFFVANEWTRQLRLGAQNNLTMPTAAERIGDFSATHDASGKPIIIKDPSNNNTPFPNNFIPLAQRNADGIKILNFYPLPNLPVGTNPGYNSSVQLPIQDNPRQNIVRIDYNINDRWRVFFRAIVDPRPITSVYGDQNSGNNVLLGAFSVPQNGSAHMGNLTTVITPTLTNEVVLGRAWGEIGAVPLDDTYKMSKVGLSFKTIYPNADPAGFIPNFTFGGVSNGPSTSFNGLPYYNQNPTHEIADNVAKLWGAHTFKAGFFRSSSVKQQTNSVPTSGNMSFASDSANPVDTGYAFSNALLGNYTSFQQASALSQLYFRMSNVEWYAQDNWKVTRSLALDYGMRFAWVAPNTEINNQISSWLPSLYDPSKKVTLYQPALDANNKQVAVNPLTGQLVPKVLLGAVVAGSGDTLNGIRQQGQNGYPDGLINSRGVQYGPRFGVAWNPHNGLTVFRFGFGVYYDRIQGNITMDNSKNPPMVLTPQTFYGNVSTLAGAGGNVFPSSVNGLSQDGHIPTTYNYNFTIQRTLPFGTSLEVAYVGSQSRHLPFLQAPNDPAFGSAWLPQNQDPTVTPKYDGTTTLPVNLTRPYIGVGESRVTNWGGSSNYNSLQVSANHRLTKGLEFGVTYTWSKALGAVSDRTTVIRAGQGRNDYYGPLSFDRRNVLVANYTWSLPKLARGSILNNPVGRVALNGWVLSGITTFDSGAPSGIGFSQIGSLTGAGLNRSLTGSETIGARATLTGNPMLSKSAQTMNAFINTSVVLPAVKGSHGSEAAQYVFVRPGINNSDLSAFKNIPFWKGEGRYIQLRFESFNAFNHTQWSNVNSTAIFNAAGAITNLPTALGGGGGLYGFGALNSVRSARVIQLAAKIYF